LDFILGGGFPRRHLYLIEGETGTGKTTMSLQFCLEGARNGEKALYITLSETRDELMAVAASHGWSLDGIEIFEFQLAEGEDDSYTLFHPREVELSETMEVLLAQVDRHAPQRLVLDSLSEVRLIARDPLVYRRQMQTLRLALDARQCTSLFIDVRGPTEDEDSALKTLMHGIVAMDQVPVHYGVERRRMRVKKLRGSPFRGGYHDIAIHTGGMEVYPRLVAAEHELLEPRRGTGDDVGTGNAAFDALLGGGLARGTSTLILGPAGSGKSTIAMQLATAAVERGDKVLLYAFEESVRSIVERWRGMGKPIERYLEDGTVVLRKVDPAALTPGQLWNDARLQVEERGVSLIIVDSLNGYLQAAPEERFMTLHVQELVSYLNHRNVLTVLVMAHHGLVGSETSSIEVSYIADTVVLLRFFEANGAIRKAISVVKKRTGPHETSIREFLINQRGLQMGEPLVNFQGVLSGNPVYLGESAPLLDGQR
jgi:circadian clock protein KaiC